jgi:hypothetical protein
LKKINDSCLRQVPEIILNESSKNTENALIEWLWKATARYFMKTQVVSLVLSLVLKTLWNIFSTSGLSYICKMRNIWKLSNSDPLLRKYILEFKNIILEEKLSNKFKNKPRILWFS